MSAARSTSSIYGPPRLNCLDVIPAKAGIHPAAASMVADVAPGLCRDDEARLSRPHAEAALAGFAQLFGNVGELDRETACVARIDDLLDPERLGSAERRAQPVQALVDL